MYSTAVTDHKEKIKKEVCKKLEGEVRKYCIRTHKCFGVLILNRVLQDYVNTSVTFIQYGRNPVISVNPSDVIVVTGLGSFVNVAGVVAAFIGTVIGLAFGALRGEGIVAEAGFEVKAGAGAVAAAVGFTIISAIGGAVVAAVVTGWIARLYSYDLHCQVKDILPQLGRVEEQKDGRIHVTITLDATT